MLALSLGYPLGVNQGAFIIQLGYGIKYISYQKAALWMSFHGVKEVLSLKNDAQLFQELVNEGLVACADTPEGLLEKIAKIVPVRQGAGSVHENHTAIYLGEKVAYPNTLQWLIWINCDGKKTIVDIFHAVRSLKGISVPAFIATLGFLVESDLAQLI